jgi:hypothetical protein
MKNIAKVVLIFLSFSLFSCETNTAENQEEIIDEYYLQAVTSSGKVYKIGNNTGEAAVIAQIPTQHNLLILQSICRVDSKIYAIESSYIPNPNRLIIYDLNQNSTSHVQLVFPNSILSAMSEPFVVTMKHNGSQFLALVVDTSGNSSRLVAIDDQSFEVTDLGIYFTTMNVTSTVWIENDLFISTMQNGLYKINLSTNSITELLDNGNRIYGTRLSKISNSKLAVLKRINSLMNGVKPFEYDLTLNTFTDKSLGNNYSVGSVYGNSFFYQDEVLDFVFLEEYDGTSNDGSIVEFPSHIIKANYTTNEIKTVRLPQREDNIIIIGIVE